MFSQMCDAVAACHEQKVFHRDIKPENFIVTDAWVDKLTLKDGEKIVKKERKVVVVGLTRLLAQSALMFRDPHTQAW